MFRIESEKKIYRLDTSLSDHKIESINDEVYKVSPLEFVYLICDNEEDAIKQADHLKSCVTMIQEFFKDDPYRNFLWIYVLYKMESIPKFTRDEKENIFKDYGLSEQEFIKIIIDFSSKQFYYHCL